MCGLFSTLQVFHVCRAVLGTGVLGAVEIVAFDPNASVMLGIFRLSAGEQ